MYVSCVNWILCYAGFAHTLCWTKTSKKPILIPQDPLNQIFNLRMFDNQNELEDKTDTIIWKHRNQTNKMLKESHTQTQEDYSGSTTMWPTSTVKRRTSFHWFGLSRYKFFLEKLSYSRSSHITTHEAKYTTKDCF